ncbi:MAG TPA: RDD family protein [Pyrinomonadaceae bacterium]|nr:RDD family protein [Pyrinomonadaceae bacterium]
MNPTAERQLPARTSRQREVIKDFVPEDVKAPFILRCGALIIDYVVVVVVPVFMLLLGRLTGDSGSSLLDGELNNAGWLIAILLALSNSLLLPMYSGQTLGKMVTGIRVVRLDGGHANPGTILFRQIVGGLFFVFSATLSFVFSIFSGKGRALHDYIAGTVVIFADRNTSR